MKSRAAESGVHARPTVFISSASIAGDKRPPAASRRPGRIVSPRELELTLWTGAHDRKTLRQTTPNWRNEVRYVITQNEAGKIVYQFPSN